MTIRPRRKDVDHAQPFPKEFLDDVVGVARQGLAPLNQTARDFEISNGWLHNWVKNAGVQAGHRPGLTDAERAELRGAKERIQLLKAEVFAVLL